MIFTQEANNTTGFTAVILSILSFNKKRNNRPRYQTEAVILTPYRERSSVVSIFLYLYQMNIKHAINAELKPAYFFFITVPCLVSSTI